MKTTQTVAQYIADTPPRARKALKELRAVIKAAAPEVTERISYGIPTFDLDGRYLLYLAAFDKHISIYPVTKVMVSEAGEAIAPYRSGKGTLRFPLDKRMPVALVRKLTKLRVQERRKGRR